ncbi:hypothetical protein Halar_1731 [halophilic archaeon DL31]|jgi:hypothetical protein|nr:hypothetical protein Halar_1731 [halophilic archaeon DL31]
MFAQGDSGHQQFEVSEELNDQEFVTLTHMTCNTRPENAPEAGGAQASNGMD